MVKKKTHNPAYGRVEHGVNALGSKLCFYIWTKETGYILSRSIPTYTDQLIQTAPGMLNIET